MEAARPHIEKESTVLELGPGRGSWSRAILKFIPRGQLMTVDFQDVTAWLQPERYEGRLKCFRVEDNSLDCVPDHCVDFFWSFGVLCHNNVAHIQEILRNAVSKMRAGSYAAHQYAAWDKLDAFGCEKGTIPTAFRSLPDEDIWWPRNTVDTMSRVAEKAGWRVVVPDMGLVRRDGLILLQAP
jgi:phospholipid N-methyltransferase